MLELKKTLVYIVVKSCEGSLIFPFSALPVILETCAYDIIAAKSVSKSGNRYLVIECDHPPQR